MMKVFLPFLLSWLSLPATLFSVTTLFSVITWADNKPELMLANLYSKQASSIELQHYWVSEKYDGVRAYWDGQNFISRQGVRYQAPSWFRQGLPSFPLDGELWLGRGQFDRLSGIVRKKKPIDEQWQDVRYMIFDLPNSNKSFDHRLQELNSLSNLPARYVVIKQWRVESETVLLQQLAHIVSQQGEGLMLHDGRSFYRSKRSNDLIKLKPSLDSEAVVLSYVAGNGKYQGKMGALWVEAVIDDGQGIPVVKRFKIGSGFTDHDRTHPPQIGSQITFKYSGLTSTGIPRFASYWRVRKP